MTRRAKSVERSTPAAGARPDPTFAIIQSAMRLFREQYPVAKFPDMEFDNARWDFTPRNVSRGNKGHVATFFKADFDKGGVRLAQKNEALPAPFAKILKAWMIHTNMGASQCVLAAHASRYLWEGLERNGRAARFEWRKLRNTDLEEAEQLMLERLSRSARSTYVRRLRRLVSWAIVNELVSEAVSWIGAPNPAPYSAISADDRTARLDRLPHRAVLEALGEIYLKYAKEPRDRLLICACGILLVAGFRIGELLTLPVDCLAKEVHQGRERWFIRYWKQKTRRGEFKEAIRYLSPLGAELARACIEEIKRLTRAARAQARVLERDQVRVRIPWGSSRKWLSREHTARALAVNPDSIPRLCRDSHLDITPHIIGLTGRRCRAVRYLREEVERALLKRRAPLATLVISGNRVQGLSETLLIELSAAGNAGRDSELLVKHMPGPALSAFLGASEHRSKSAFTRFGFKSLDAGANAGGFRMRSHMFRHWLNTVANKAGMTAFQITLWMQRDDDRQTLAYLHSASEIAELSREQLKVGELRGKAAEQYAALGEREREEFLVTIEEANETREGVCLKALVRVNCELEKACVLGCSYFVWNPDRVSKAAAMRKKRDAAAAGLRELDRYAEQGHIVQPRQREIITMQLAEYGAMLASLGSRDDAEK